MRTRITKHGWQAIAVSVICACALLCSVALAADSAGLGPDADTSGNIIASGETGRYDAETQIPHSIYWAGKDLSVSNATVAGDIIAAGMSITVDDGTVDGDIRTASQNASVDGTKVAGDITSAGQSVSVGAGSSCNAAYLAGADVSFSGTARALGAGAETVTISGTVKGDAHVSANKVVIEDGAVITGTLTAESANEPVVASGAKIGTLDYQKVESEQHAVPDMGGLLLSFSLFGAIYSLIVTVLAALVLAWIARRAVKGSGDMVRTRPAPMLVTGLVAGLVAIPALILLFVTVAPIGGAVLCVLIAILCIAVPFAGASLACMLLPRWNRFGASALGGLAAGVLAAIPLVGFIVAVAAYMYFAGYVLQCLYLDMRAPAAPAAPMAPTAPGAPMAPVAPAIPMTPSTPATPIAPETPTAEDPGHH